MRNLLYILSFAALALQSCASSPVFVEAESFDDTGGWVLDNQAMSAMGSPYLLAHGLGNPVVDAVTSVNLHRAGKYRLWVRTRNWVPEFDGEDAPGRFELVVNGMPVPVFGDEGGAWHWQDGGTVMLNKGVNTIGLHDLTGFDGRCDVLCLVPGNSDVPPSDKSLFKSRRTEVEEKGSYDLVVVGGGIAGCCAAVKAARLGCTVALVQNRPVLGGNNSSEVRVGLSGLLMQEPYPRLGSLVDEIGGVGYWTEWEARRNPGTERSGRILAEIEAHPEKLIHNAGPASNYEDERKMEVVSRTPGLDLFLNTELVGVKVRRGIIRSVIGQDIRTGRRIRLRGRLFADCTGDGTLGYLAGADYRVGRESRDETSEPRAPETADSLCMGTSVQWNSEATSEETPFPVCPWALQFDERSCIPIYTGEWDWETGLGRDQIAEIEYIRDYAMRAVYGNWSYLKNSYSGKDAFALRRLGWVAYIGGKRESRRLLGDVILNENDLIDGVFYDDACFTATWGVDLHFPKIVEGFDGESFLAISDSRPIEPYPVPYRCLYSRNIDNLFMAGRDISVTHVALGSVRVMRTCGMMGEVVGMAASVCCRHDALPRDVYESYLSELKGLF